jgi:FkbM family methyltransferase
MGSLKRRFKSWRDRKRGRRHRLQDMRAAPGFNLMTLGSDYGAWVFHDDGTLQGCTVFSAGLGEDASFDVEFASRYGARVVLIDPTPRAMAHHREILARVGQGAEVPYVNGGCQPATAYALDKIDVRQLPLEPFALWTQATRLRFFLPSNAEHVSHSLVNFQNDYRKDSDHIEVDSCRIDDLLVRYGIAPDELALLKLDIEGAEVEVLEDMMDKGIRPRQICVEFDELNKPCRTAFERVDRADRALNDAGYRCIYGNGTTDYLYLRDA